MCLHQNPHFCCCVRHAARRSILCVVLSRSSCSACVLYIRVALIISFLLLFTSVIILSSPPSRLYSLPASHLISSLCQPFVGSKIHTDEALQHNYPKYDAGHVGNSNTLPFCVLCVTLLMIVIKSCPFWPKLPTSDRKSIFNRTFMGHCVNLKSIRA